MRLGGWVIGLFFVYLLSTGKLTQFLQFATVKNPSSGPQSGTQALNNTLNGLSHGLTNPNAGPGTLQSLGPLGGTAL